jgi:phage tail-like protein
MPSTTYLVPTRNNFTFSIDGQLQNGVISVKNVEQSCAVIEHRDGTAAYIRKQPGRVETLRLEIEKVASGSDELVKWRSLVKDKGNPLRCSMSIGILDRNHKPVGEFVLQNAMPVGWKLRSLDSTANGNATEVLYIETERIDWKKG